MLAHRARSGTEDDPPALPPLLSLFAYGGIRGNDEAAIPLATVGAVLADAVAAVGATVSTTVTEPSSGSVVSELDGSRNGTTGAASVWNTCVMVFQMLLLAGYGYSVLLVRTADVRTGVAVHALLVAVSIAMWPFAVQALWLTPIPGWPPVAWVTAAIIAATSRLETSSRPGSSGPGSGSTSP